VLELGYPREIQQRDVNRVKERAARVQLQEDRMVLQLFPQDFVVDDHPGHRDPRKMTAARLELNVHLLTASAREHRRAGGRREPGAPGSGGNHLRRRRRPGTRRCKPEERREGVALVDIGAESTSLVVYYGDAMCLASTVRVCGSHFTSDLAQRPENQPGGGRAGEDRIRRARAGGFARERPGGIAGRREPRAAAGAEEARRDLILESRARELFQLVRSELARVSMEQRCSAASSSPAAAPGWRRFSMWRSGVEVPVALRNCGGNRDWPEAMNDRNGVPRPAWPCTRQN
jgi:cell division protein FtsA